MSKSRDAFRSDESWERWNTHQTTTVEQEVFGSVLRFVQDPSSEHLGTTVWDASVVLAKWFEKNIRKGDFARAKVRGKRAIELGAGMGLAGMAFAMVGADVVLTDTADVLGLLRINYETNLSPAAVRLARGHQHGTWADSAGSVAVAELDWTMLEQAHALPMQPPYDFVLAADCIYHETLTEHFHKTVMEVTNEKSTVVVCNELRSHSVQGRFMELFTATHTIKAVPHSKMDEKYQHPNIFIYIMKKKKKVGVKSSAVMDDESEVAGGHLEEEVGDEQTLPAGQAASTVGHEDGEALTGAVSQAESRGENTGRPSGNDVQDSQVPVASVAEVEEVGTVGNTGIKEASGQGGSVDGRVTGNSGTEAGSVLGVDAVAQTSGTRDVGEMAAEV